MRFLAPNMWIFIEPSVIWEFSENDGGLNNNSTSKSPLYGTIYGDIGARGLKIWLHVEKYIGQFGLTGTFGPAVFRKRRPGIFD